MTSPLGAVAGAAFLSILPEIFAGWRIFRGHQRSDLADRHPVRAGRLGRAVALRPPDTGSARCRSRWSSTPSAFVTAGSVRARRRVLDGCVRRANGSELIGPNGAGKRRSSTPRPASPLSTGTITLGTRRLDGCPRIASPGRHRAHVPKHPAVRERLDVRTNLAAGAYARPGRLPTTRRERCSNAPASRTSTSTRSHSALPCRRSAPARDRARVGGVPGDPDAGRTGGRHEPGLETARLGRTIRALANDGIGILLIEHDMTLVRGGGSRHTGGARNFGEVFGPRHAGRNRARSGVLSKRISAQRRHCPSTRLRTGLMALLDVSGLRAGYGKIESARTVDVALEPARCARSSARTARARRRCCSRSPRSFPSAAAASSSTAPT